MSISAYQSSLVASSTTGSAMQSLSGNQNTFLQLLTTQLKNQDPLAPTDTNTFTQQLVEYSQVEQQIDTNSKLDGMTKLLGNTQIQGALATVGSFVQYAGSSFNYTGSGNYTMDYNLPSAAASATLTITDANGNEIYTTAAPSTALSSGDNAFVWNGQTDQGLTAAAGTYNIAVTAKDSAGNSITPTTSVWGQVTQVQATNSDVDLILSGGNSIPFNSVSSISPTLN